MATAGGIRINPRSGRARPRERRNRPLTSMETASSRPGRRQSLPHVPSSRRVSSSAAGERCEAAIPARVANRADAAQHDTGIVGPDARRTRAQFRSPPRRRPRTFRPEHPRASSFSDSGSQALAEAIEDIGDHSGLPLGQTAGTVIACRLRNAHDPTPLGRSKPSPFEDEQFQLLLGRNDPVVAWHRRLCRRCPRRNGLRRPWEAPGVHPLPPDSCRIETTRVHVGSRPKAGPLRSTKGHVATSAPPGRRRIATHAGQLQLRACRPSFSSQRGRSGGLGHGNSFRCPMAQQVACRAPSERLPPNLRYFFAGYCEARAMCTPRLTRNGTQV